MLTIRVETQPGQSIGEACEQLCLLASRLGCLVRSEFNGVGISAKPGADPRELYAFWEAAQNNASRFRYVCAQPIECPRPWDTPAAGKPDSESR